VSYLANVFQPRLKELEISERIDVIFKVAKGISLAKGITGA
jgi:hypothetical protein